MQRVRRRWTWEGPTEADTSSKYAHCFVRSYGWFELGDSIFITMEYPELGDLQAHLGRPLPEYEARQIASQVLEGLSFMHDNGFVHGDLKPGVRPFLVLFRYRLLRETDIQLEEYHGCVSGIGLVREDWRLWYI